MTARFVNSVITNSGTLNITDGVQTAVNLDNVGITAGATLTQIGAGDLNITTQFRTELAGSADMLMDATFRLVDNTGSGSVTDIAAVFDNTGGLWNLDNAGGASNTIDVSLNALANLGSVTIGGPTLSFSESSSGYVVIGGLVSGTDYLIELDLASLDTDINDVVTELMNNEAYSNVIALDGDTVQISYTATADGSGNFAWDNVNSLGGNVVGVGAAVIPEPSTFLLSSLGLLGLALRRRRR